MTLTEQRFHFFLQHLGVVAFGRSEHKEIEFIAGVIGYLHGCKRQNNCFINRTADTDTGIVRVNHSNHLIIDAVGFNHQTQGIFVGTYHILVHLLSQHAHFSGLGYIGLVDETAANNLASVYFIVIGQHSFHAEIAAFYSVKHVVFAVVSIHAGYWRNPIYSLDFLFDGFQVGHIEIPIASLLIAFVRLGGQTGNHKSGIGGKALDIAAQSVVETVAASQQNHQNEYAPEHAECRQQTSGLVPGNRLPNLVYIVYIKHIPNS